MTYTVEGTAEEVLAQLKDLPINDAQHLHDFINVSDKSDEASPVISKQITFEMFSEFGPFNDEDFKSAEYHDDADENLQ